MRFSILKLATSKKIAIVGINGDRYISKYNIYGSLFYMIYLVNVKILSIGSLNEWKKNR